MNKSLIAIVAAGSAVLAGCGGRAANIQPTIQPWDTRADCEQLMMLHNDAITQATRKLQLQQASDNSDAAIGIAGALLFWPALFFIDTQNAEGAEAQNLMDRAASLRGLAITKSCDVEVWPAAPQIKPAQAQVSSDTENAGS